MAKIIVQEGYNLRALASLAGSSLDKLLYNPGDGEFEVPDVDQESLDNAMEDYSANQAQRDVSFEEAKVNAETVKEQNQFDESRSLGALSEWMLDELNLVRVEQGLPKRTPAQIRIAIHKKISRN